MKRNELHSLAAQEYFAAPGVSASMLEKIRISPAHLRAYMDGELESDSPALSLGTLAHRAIFEPDTLTPDSVVMQPETIWIEAERVKKLDSAQTTGNTDGSKVEIQWNDRISECKRWAGEQTLPIVDRREWKKAVRIRDNAHHDGSVRALLKGGYAEQALFVEDSGGTLRKSRFDYITTAGNAIPDVKTCRSAHPDKFEKVIENLGYFQRAAFYIDNANLAGIPKEAFVFICVETTPPFLVTLYNLDEDVIQAGRMCYERDLQLYRNCVESNDWPGYHRGIRQIGLPPYLMRKLQEEKIL